MATVGERLRLDREARNMTIDEMAAATGIGRSYLEALEANEIQVLPGPAFGKLYIRAYAEVLGFEPQSWIEDYDRERRFDPQEPVDPPSPGPTPPRPVKAAIAEWREARMKEQNKPDDDVGPADASVEAAPEIEADQPLTQEVVVRSRRPVVVLMVSGLLTVAAVIYFMFAGNGAKDPTPAVTATQQPAPRPPIAPPPATPPPAMPPPATPPTAGPLSVTEFGVGRRIVNLRLEGESDHFAPGDRVCFSSRVIGGQRGGIVRHVWLYEGRTQQTITLRLGGPDWRTHTNKTLGHAGDWAVEARDDKGRVLARATFTCAAAEP